MEKVEINPGWYCTGFNEQSEADMAKLKGVLLDDKNDILEIVHLGPSYPSPYRFAKDTPDYTLVCWKRYE